MLGSVLKVEMDTAMNKCKQQTVKEINRLM